MTRQNRKIWSFGRVGALAFLVLVAVSSVSAISPDSRPGQRRQARREGEIRAMDIFAQNYGGADWSGVTSSLAAHPEDPANPRIMSVFLSLGNVYLTRFEERSAVADLDRALGLFEAVAGSEELWGRRPFAGSVVAYLGISLARLAGECDVSGYEGRIDQLRQKVIEVSSVEAGAVAEAEIDAETFLATTPEEDAARAALYAAAAVLRPEDPRAKTWEQDARFLGARLSSLETRSAETEMTLSQAALLYEMSGGAVPPELEQFFTARPVVVAFRGLSSTAGVQTGEPASVVEPGEPLDTAVRESRFVAARLSEYLRQFPPGSQCESEEGETDRPL